MPVEGAIPDLPGIEMYGNSVPAETVGGDLFEYINFQQRYDIDARIKRALRLSKEFLEPLPQGAPLRNSVDDHVQWLRSTPGYRPEMETEYQRRAEFGAGTSRGGLARALYYGRRAAGRRAGARNNFSEDRLDGPQTLSCFDALRTRPIRKNYAELFENLNLRLAQSVTARNASGITEKENAREIAACYTAKCVQRPFSIR